MDEKIIVEKGSFVYKMIEDDGGWPFLMQGVVVDVRVVEHPDPTSRYYPRYTEVDVRWFAGAPDNIVEHWGFDECARQEWFWTNPKDAVEHYKKGLARQAERADSRLADLLAAQAAGRTVTFPKEEEAD